MIDGGDSLLGYLTNGRLGTGLVGGRAPIEWPTDVNVPIDRELDKHSITNCMYPLEIIDERDGNLGMERRVLNDIHALH